MHVLTDDTKEQKIKGILKRYFRKEDEEVITKKIWLVELDLLTNFHADNIGHIVSVRPKLVMKKTG